MEGSGIPRYPNTWSSIKVSSLRVSEGVKNMKSFFAASINSFSPRSGVEGCLLVKALDCGSKGPGFQSHLQQRFISLLGALSPTPKIE